MADKMKMPAIVWVNHGACCATVVCTGAEVGAGAIGAVNGDAAALGKGGAASGFAVTAANTYVINDGSVRPKG